MVPHVTSDLRIDPALRSFVVDELLPGLDIEPERFWAALVDLQDRFAGRISTLLARRDELQEQVDAWHREHGAGDPDAYAAFLTDIGYLVPDTVAHLSVTGVDREIAEVAGPQLVVPATVPRYALNAANARWARSTTPSTAPTRSRWTTTWRRVTTSSAAPR